MTRYITRWLFRSRKTNCLGAAQNEGDGMVKIVQAIGDGMVIDDRNLVSMETNITNKRPICARPGYEATTMF